MMCPYCGNDHGFSGPVALCSGMPENLGIAVPRIQQCERCKATLTPAAFRPGTDAFNRARAAKASRSA